METKPIIGISVGDINGIGPEIIIKTFSDNRMLEFCTPVIFASNKLINYYRRTLQDHPFSFNSTKDLNKLQPKQVNIFNCWEEEVGIQPGVLNETGGKYALRSLMVAVQCLKDGQLDALVTAPFNKANTSNDDFPYAGHTSYLRDRFDLKEVLMVLYHNQLRVGLVTEHTPIKDIAREITPQKVTAKIDIFLESLRKDFGIDKPKLAVLALNPHAGDEGRIGTEELEFIKDIVKKYQNNGHLVYGPFGADAFWARGNYDQFDGILAMYHDQGLIPFKMLAGGEGVNFTAGMQVIRTSPDHGTAFDIAGKGIADERSLREAVFQSIELLKARQAFQERTKNPLKRNQLQQEQ
jgi:4-hydroxythreonine-4-phosphate dehydrogenase